MAVEPCSVKLYRYMAAASPYIWNNSNGAITFPNNALHVVIDRDNILFGS